VKVLYLSYDGMTDPLGSSQVIPYLRGLASKGHEITLVSCEKPKRFRESEARIRGVLGAALIDWHPIPYHKRPPILSTLWDVRRMRSKAFELAKRKKIELVHCRSYVPSLIGLKLKREHGLRFVFDMRGFWADERIDGGLWDLARPHYRMVYRYFKRMEKRFINESDRTVSLTHAGRDEMRRWEIDRGAAERIEVIPCCADLDHFDRRKVSGAELERWRSELRLREDDYVVSYLGSLGTWYMLEERLGFFRALLKKRPEAKLLFITPDEPELIYEAADQAGVDRAALRVRAALRDEVPGLLSLSSLGLFFIRPSYSKISSSPTKMAEMLAMGIPLVTNAGVGDSDWLSSKFRVGGLVRNFGEAEFERVIAEMPGFELIPPERIRAAASEYFSLTSGVEAYDRIYAQAEKAVTP
jgi:glycosyltransferase involved in cell wall biosynthesis